MMEENVKKSPTSLQTAQDCMTTLTTISKQPPHEGHIEEPAEYVHPVGTSSWVSVAASGMRQEG